MKSSLLQALRMLDQTFDRLQKLIESVKLLDEKDFTRAVNQKLFKIIYHLSGNILAVNMAFVSSSNNNTSSTNEAVNTAHGVSTASTQGVQSSRNTRQQEQRKLQKGVPVETLLHIFSPDSRFESSGEITIRGLEELEIALENYNAVPPLYTGNFMPPTSDLSFMLGVLMLALSIEEWVSDDEEEDVSQPKIEKKTVRPSIVKKEFIKSKQQQKTARKTVKQGNPQMDLKDKGVIDSGCSRHMTGNMSYLTNYEEIDGGYVAFGGPQK
ncbi:hypothetical protein Tco_0908017 [Tanacetum coccineum]|uniref:Retrovirus-related Pol polyprotein from transposon TNT 1-94-like beta-barrel domain-containing protein n=1 Tax=Tanacetum coccineum TaxID=301880 RepID=A0ABQ5CN22_9ASTR